MKKIIITILLLLIACPLFASEITDDYLDIAKNYLNTDNNKKAEEYIDLILMLDPNNEKAKSFKELTTPDEINVNKDNLKKIKTKAILSSHDDESSQLNNEGVSLYNEEEIDYAIKYFKKAIFVNRKNFLAYYNLGLCYKHLGKNALAERNFKLSYSKNKCFTQGLVNLANMKFGKEKLYYLELAASEKDPEAFFYLGEIFLQNKDYLAALKNYIEVLIINPNLAEAYLKAAECYYQLEDYDMAAINLKNYMTYVADNDYAYFLLAKSYRHLGYNLKAVKEINSAIKINSRSEYFYELAKICYWEQNYDIAIYILKKIVTNSNNAGYYNYLGLCYFEMGDLKAAKESFNRAIEIDPKSATIYFNLSKCDTKNAAEYIEKAKQIVPQTSKQAIDLSMMYYKISDNTNAMKEINKAMFNYGYNDKSVYKAKMRLCKLIGNYIEYEKTKADLATRFGVK